MNTEDMLDLSHEFEMAKMQIELRQVSDPDVLREMCIQLIGINQAQRAVFKNLFMLTDDQ